MKKQIFFIFGVLFLSNLVSSIWIYQEDANETITSTTSNFGYNSFLIEENTFGYNNLNERRNAFDYNYL